MIIKIYEYWSEKLLQTVPAGVLTHLPRENEFVHLSDDGYCEDDCRKVVKVVHLLNLTVPYVAIYVM